MHEYKYVHINWWYLWFCVPVSMSLSTKVGDMGRNLPIPDDIDELLPVDMTELIQFVPQMAHKWCEIGMYLELKNCVRELKDSHHTSKLKLITILDTWIESGREVSWCRLVEVLEQPGVELGAVALEIKQHLYEKCTVPQHNMNVCVHMYDVNAQYSMSSIRTCVHVACQQGDQLFTPTTCPNLQAQVQIS